MAYASIKGWLTVQTPSSGLLLGRPHKWDHKFQRVSLVKRARRLGESGLKAKVHITRDNMLQCLLDIGDAEIEFLFTLGEPGAYTTPKVQGVHKDTREPTDWWCSLTTRNLPDTL